MTSEHKTLRYGRDILDAGFCVLRTPTLPAEDFLNWTNELEQTRLAGAELEADELESAWRRDVCVLRTRLKSLLDRPEISRALLIASPALQSGIPHWRSNPDSKKGLRAQRTLVRYLVSAT